MDLSDLPYSLLTAYDCLLKFVFAHIPIRESYWLVHLYVVSPVFFNNLLICYSKLWDVVLFKTLPVVLYIFPSPFQLFSFLFSCVSMSASFL